MILLKTMVISLTCDSFWRQSSFLVFCKKNYDQSINDHRIAEDLSEERKEEERNYFEVIQRIDLNQAVVKLLMSSLTSQKESLRSLSPNRETRLTLSALTLSARCSSQWWPCWRDKNLVKLKLGLMKWYKVAPTYGTATMEGSPCTLTRQLELADMAELLYRWPVQALQLIASGILAKSLLENRLGVVSQQWEFRNGRHFTWSLIFSLQQVWSSLLLLVHGYLSSWRPRHLLRCCCQVSKVTNHRAEKIGQKSL